MIDSFQFSPKNQFQYLAVGSWVYINALVSICIAICIGIAFMTVGIAFMTVLM